MAEDQSDNGEPETLPPGEAPQADDAATTATASTEDAPNPPESPAPRRREDAEDTEACVITDGDLPDPESLTTHEAEDGDTSTPAAPSTAGLGPISSTLEPVETEPASIITGDDETATAATTTLAHLESSSISEDDLAAEHEQDRRHPLSALARGAALLMGIGASFGLALWELWNRSVLPAYVKSNKIEVGARKAMLVCVIVGVFLVLLSLLGYLYRHRKALAPACRTIERLAWKLSPFILVGLLPLLFHWRLWKNNDVIFLVMVGFMGFCTQKLLYRALSTPPLFSRDKGRWARLCDRVRALGEDTSTWLPWAVVIGVFVFYAIYFSYFTVQNHWNLRTSAYDLAIEDNVVYNAMYGEMLKASPMFGPTGIHLGHHATFFAFLLAPFYALSPEAETLLVIQAIIIGAAVIPLFLFARNRLGPWYAAIIAVMYVLYAPVHGANLYDFHYPPLGIGFVFWTMYLVDIKRYRWAALAIVLSLSVREDIALEIFVVGAYFLLSNRRPKAGLIIAAVGIGYFVIMKMGVMPAVRGGKESFAWYYKDLIPPGGPKGFSGILATIGGNPGYTLSRLLQDEKILYVLQIMTPFAFLPWRRGIGFVFCLPGLLMTLLAHREASYQISFQYTAHWSIGMFLAVVIILTMMKRPAWPGDDRGRIRVASWIWAMVIAMLATSYQHGAILQQNTARGGFMAFKFNRTEKDVARYDALWALIHRMPADAKVASTERLLPHMSNRRDAYTLRTVGIRDAEFIIFPRRMSPKEHKRVRPALVDGVFGVVAEEKDLYLAKRGHDVALNAKAIKKLRRPPKKRGKAKSTKRKKAKSKAKKRPKLKAKPKRVVPPFRAPKKAPTFKLPPTN